ncbi:unnamed protein product [Ixodes hexagonus]
MQMLFKRADPNTPESDRVARVRRQCHSKYHVYFINRTYETLEELSRGAHLIEEATYAERSYKPPPPVQYALERHAHGGDPRLSHKGTVRTRPPFPPTLILRVGVVGTAGTRRAGQADGRLTLPERSQGVTEGSVRVLGGGRHDRVQVAGSALVQAGAQRRSPRKRTIFISLRLQLLASWHAGGPILQPRSTDPRSIGQSPPGNSRSQARWRPSQSGSLSDHWRWSADGHLGACDQSRQLSSDRCSDCEQPGHHHKCSRPLDTTNKSWHRTAADGQPN